MAATTRKFVVLSAVLWGLLGGIRSQADRAAELDWRSDPLMIASVSLPAKTLTLKEVCDHLARQTSAEFYVDRRHADAKAAFYTAETHVETAMNVIESVTGLEWRLVDDIFFLSPDARGAAVTRWGERYAEAKKAQLTRTAEGRVRQWLYATMPFPPCVDMPWQLTPIQREQISYQETLSIFTMTAPQLDWLNSALREKGYQPADVGLPTDLLVQTSPDIPVKLNAAMVIDSPAGAFIIEKSLSPPVGTATPTVLKKPTTVEPRAPEPEHKAKKTSLKESLNGIWVTGEDLSNLASLLNKAKRREIDNLFLPVLKSGQTIYPSKVLPPHDAKSSVGDRLKQAITNAADLGVKVHAVVDTTLWGDADHPLPRRVGYTAIEERNLLGRTYAEQEEWQRRELRTLYPDSEPTAESDPENKRFYLCPASFRVSRLVRSIVQEIASNYDVAGICLDGVDYPRSTPLVLAGRDLAPPYGYTTEVRKGMIRLHQLDPVDIDPAGIWTAKDAGAFALWDRFRRGRLTGLVTEVCAALKALRPEAVCSVTLDLTSEAQSPAHWSKIAGLDALLPYVTPTAPPDELAVPGSELEAGTQAVIGLHRAVLNNAAVAPLVGEIKATDLVNQLVPTARTVKMTKEHGLKGCILCGDVSALLATLEALAD